ncbi:MAG: hypothetical protein ACJAZT_001474 [Gammaproteobacteria bacterium]
MKSENALAKEEKTGLAYIRKNNLAQILPPLEEKSD